MEPAPPANDPPPLSPPDSLNQPPRRRFSWRDFLIGVGAGIVLTIVGAVLLVAAFVALGRGLAAGQNGVREAMLPAPDFPPHGQIAAYGHADMNWTFETLTGTSSTLSDYRGKVVFLNFWATWCGPCIAEMPSIQKLRDNLKRDDVAFLLVSDEDIPTIEGFLRERRLRLPVFHARGAVPPLFHTSAIPATFIIDENGMVVLRSIGAARWNTEASVVFLKTLLDGGRPAVAGR